MIKKKMVKITQQMVVNEAKPPPDWVSHVVSNTLHTNAVRQLSYNEFHAMNHCKLLKRYSPSKHNMNLYTRVRLERAINSPCQLVIPWSRTT